MTPDDKPDEAQDTTQGSETQQDRDVNRRDVLKKGAAATGIGALATGAASGNVAAQEHRRGRCYRYLRDACRYFHRGSDYSRRGDHEDAQYYYEQGFKNFCWFWECLCEYYGDDHGWYCDYADYYCGYDHWENGNGDDNGNDN